MAFYLEFEEEDEEDAVDFRPLRRLLVRARLRVFFAFNFSTYPPRYMDFLPRRRFVFPPPLLFLLLLGIKRYSSPGKLPRLACPAPAPFA